MADRITAAQRSALMAKIRGKDTRPEMAVRSLLHGAGFRFRLHAKDLPGRPDLVLPKHRAVVFVHGCFWHRHARCRDGRSMPASNRSYWVPKFERNLARDRRVKQALRRRGWRVITVWECQIKRNPDDVLRRVAAKLVDG
jgi:DNA mismatch endonuclease (patch repair protein)